MDNLYLLLFAAGVICAVVHVFLGGIFRASRNRGNRSVFLQPTALVTFVTVFGGSGYVLGRNADFGGWRIALLAIVIAIISMLLMVVFVLLPQSRAERSATGSAREMVGKTAEVVNVIMHGRKGEIVYDQDGEPVSAPALIAGGEPVRRGDVVRIVGVENGTLVVEKTERAERNAPLRA